MIGSKRTKREAEIAENDDADLVGSSFVLPDDALRDVPPELRATR